MVWPTATAARFVPRRAASRWYCAARYVPLLHPAVRAAVAATVLKSEAEIMAAVEAGTVGLFTGTPDTHSEGFVVNCPSPVLAPNTYDPAQFAAATPAT